jgi:hypothetical protein
MHRVLALIHMPRTHLERLANPGEHRLKGDQQYPGLLQVTILPLQPTVPVDRLNRYLG